MNPPTVTVRLKRQVEHLSVEGPVRLSCLSLNVCGVKNKVQMDDLKDLVKKRDICCFIESKLTDTDVAEFEGYASFYKNREYPEHPSGGVLTLIKESVLPFVTVYEDEKREYDVNTSIKEYYKFVKYALCSEAIFFKVGKDYMGQDIMFVGAYIAPEGSKYANVDVFSQIEESLLFLNARDICILGDLNARTAEVQEVFEERTFIDIFEWNVEGDSRFVLPDRVSQDKIKKPNKWGWRLIELCKNFNLAVVNGRTGADYRIGKHTCNNISVVDYFILSRKLFNRIKGFDILNFNKKLSDVHCPLVLELERAPNDAQEDEPIVNSDEYFCIRNFVKMKQPCFFSEELLLDALISLHCMIHHCLEKKKGLYYVFIDDGKARGDLINYLFRNRERVMGNNFSSDEEHGTIKMFRPSFSEHREFFSETIENLQNVLHSIENYCNKQNIQIDPNKIRIIAFCKGEIQTNEEIYFNGEKLDVVRHFYYFSFDTNLRNVYDRASREMFFLLRNRLLPESFKSMLFERSLLPILTNNCKKGLKTNCLCVKLHTRFHDLINKERNCTTSGMVPDEDWQSVNIHDKSENLAKFWFQMVSKENNNVF